MTDITTIKYRYLIILSLLMAILLASCGEEKAKSGKLDTRSTKALEAGKTIIASFDKVDRLRNYSSVPRIKKSMAIIDQSRKDINESSKTIDEYVKFYKKYKYKVNKADRPYYDNLIIILDELERLSTRHAMHYMNEFKGFLIFCVDNFDRIRSRDLSTTKTYDIHLMKYKKSLNEYISRFSKSLDTIEKHSRHHSDFVNEISDYYQFVSKQGRDKKGIF